MEQELEQYLEKSVSECLQIPAFSSLPPWQQQEVANKIRNHFSRAIITTLISKLNENQLAQIQDLEFDSPEMEEKIQTFAAQIPGFIFDIEETLNKEAEKIKQTGQIPK